MTLIDSFNIIYKSKMQEDAINEKWQRQYSFFQESSSVVQNSQLKAKTKPALNILFQGFYFVQNCVSILEIGFFHFWVCLLHI